MGIEPTQDASAAPADGFEDRVSTSISVYDRPRSIEISLQESTDVRSYVMASTMLAVVWLSGKGGLSSQVLVLETLVSSLQTINRSSRLRPLDGSARRQSPGRVPTRCTELRPTLRSGGPRPAKPSRT